MRRRNTVPGIAAVAVAAIAAATATATTASATAGKAGETRTVATAVGTPRRAPATGSVLGMFELKGGPVRPGAKGGTSVRPLSGVITFRDKKEHMTDLTAGKNGHFAGKLPAGTYTVTARSPQIRQQNPNGTYSDPSCAGPVTVIVRAAHTTPLTLACVVP